MFFIQRPGDMFFIQDLNKEQVPCPLNKEQVLWASKKKCTGD
jgi:hypothetical protein